MRDVNLIASYKYDYNYVYFIFKDEITTTKKFINFFNFMENNHRNTPIFKGFSENEYKLKSTHNLNREYEIRPGDTFIADIIFYNNNHREPMVQVYYYPYVCIKNTNIDESFFERSGLSNNE